MSRAGTVSGVGAGDDREAVLLARHLARWKVVRNYIEEHIAIGTYPVGSWLPSVRQLADELGINRNTITKAYQALGHSGLLELVHGSGVRVVATTTVSISNEARVFQQMRSVVRDARQRGLPREWVRAQLLRAADEAYESSSDEIGFVECTDVDSRGIGDDLARHLGVDVRPLVLKNLAEIGTAELRQMRVVATTFFHLREVSEILAGSGIEILGINHAVSHESAVAIARIERGAAIAVVAPNVPTLERVSEIVESLSRDTLACTTEDRSELQKILSMADVVVDVAMTHDTVKRLRPEVRTITVGFHIEPGSVEHLRDVLRKQRVSAPGEEQRGLRGAEAVASPS
jgi:DNA-binding transcriptional regulator YhcF (GntR family)